MYVIDVKVTIKSNFVLSQNLYAILHKAVCDILVWVPILITPTVCILIILNARYVYTVDIHVTSKIFYVGKHSCCIF